jgi:hypothetical protein
MRGLRTKTSLFEMQYGHSRQGLLQEVSRMLQGRVIWFDVQDFATRVCRSALLRTKDSTDVLASCL